MNHPQNLGIRALRPASPSPAHATSRRAFIATASLLLLFASAPAIATVDDRSETPVVLGPLSESDSSTANSTWLDAGNWTSPITGIVYTLQKSSILPNYVYDGTQPLSPEKFTSPSGDVFPSWQDVIQAEIDASGQPASIFKAEKNVRDAYASHDLTLRPMLVTLTTQPVLTIAPQVWAAYNADLRTANDRARANTDPNLTEQYAQAIEDLMTQANAEIIQNATQDLLTSQASAILNLTLAGFPGAIPVGKTLSILQVQAAPAALDKLTAVPDVLAISFDEITDAKLNVATPSTGQSSFTSAGYTGGSMDVAVVDSGIDFTHPTYAARGAKEANVSSPKEARTGTFATPPQTRPISTVTEQESRDPSPASGHQATRATRA